MSNHFLKVAVGMAALNSAGVPVEKIKETDLNEQFYMNRKRKGKTTSDKDSRRSVRYARKKDE